MTASVETAQGVGRVARVTGPVVDVEFPVEAMPELFNALHVDVDFGQGEEGGGNRTLTLGKDSELVEVAIDWAQNPPLIRAAVRVSDPQLPTARQVAAVQAFINGHQPIRYRLVVQRVSVDVIGPETAPNPEDSRPRPPEVGGFAVP